MALRRARQSRSDERDCADMGTAFGLDASFDLQAAPPDQRTPPPALPRWESRLVRRSGL
jgi:hypothetical protein